MKAEAGRMTNDDRGRDGGRAKPRNASHHEKLGGGEEGGSPGSQRERSPADILISNF